MASGWQCDLLCLAGIDQVAVVAGNLHVAQHFDNARFGRMGGEHRCECRR